MKLQFNTITKITIYFFPGISNLKKMLKIFKGDKKNTKNNSYGYDLFLLKKKDIKLNKTLLNRIK